MSAKRTKGMKSDPYTGAEYEAMVSSESWPGGWVKFTSQLHYITRNGIEQMDSSAGDLGSFTNPFYEVAYDEMRDRKEWPGGYVLFGDIPMYRRSSDEEYNEASGCGCGSGEKTEQTYGSGDGFVLPGVATIDTEHFRIEVSWTEGSTIPGEREASEIYMNSITITDEKYVLRLGRDQTTVEWIEAYTIRVYISYYTKDDTRLTLNHDEATVKLISL